MSRDEDNSHLLLDEIDEELEENKYLMCKLGNEIFGIDIGHVTDIIELQKITEVPDMPEHVKGVINLRGNVIPVIDLRNRFAMEEKEYDDRTVITVVSLKERSIGFIIDTATEVQAIPEDQIDPPPRFSDQEGKQRFILGLGKVGEQLIILLDIEKLVHDDYQLSQMGQTQAG